MMSDLQLSSEIKSVVENIYAGIDLIKPAHVGLRLSIDIGGDEVVPIVSGMTDSLEITMELVEPSPLEDMFTMAPLGEDSPESLLNSQGLISPRIDTAWEIKDEELSGLDFM